MAFAVVAFTVITYYNFRIPLDYDLLVFIFFGTITGYNFIKYAPIAKFHHSSLSNNLKAIQIFSFVIFTGLIITLFLQGAEVLFTSAILGLFTLFYAFPFFGKQRKLRDVPGLKIFIISFVVAGVTVLLPLVDKENFPFRDHIIDFIQRCIIAMVLILPFEIRDMEKDDTQLSTIPQKIGVARTKLFGYIMILAFILMEFMKSNIHSPYLISLFLLGILSFIFLKRSSVEQEEYFASFWVEAAPWFWLGILWTLDYII